MRQCVTSAIPIGVDRALAPAQLDKIIRGFMPARDVCHQQVVHALEKARWTVERSPNAIAPSTRHILYVDHEVNLYAAGSDTVSLHPLVDDDRLNYAVIAVSNMQTGAEQSVSVVVMARVVDEVVEVEVDSTDSPLVDALMVNGGVPRERIVLAYKGESYRSKSE